YLPSRPLIDLAGGSLSIMAKFAEIHNAGPCDNVEITYRDLSGLPPSEDKEKFKPLVSPTIVKMDILDFLSKLEPKGGYTTANYTINGFDILMVQNDQYHEAVATELGRVVQTGSIVFGMNSMVLEKLGRYGFTRIEIPGAEMFNEEKSHYGVFVKN
ncbi:MAG TPA: hypothetical protein VGO21_03795, partial [Candidatus Paceibacterota bacterium]|nr:hypothetical protein [Candidatus Paceibacterota bacterium]